MPTVPNPSPGPEPSDKRKTTRVILVPGGPILLRGPVEVTLDDGTVARSDRFMVALCGCRRSHRYPFCDTSHRRRTRAGPPD